MRSRQLTFPGANGEQLSARLDLPGSGEPLACALFAHCFTCSKNLNAAANISRALTEERCAVLRFDFTGLGQSEGEFAETNFSSNVGDLVAAARFMEGEGLAPFLLIGHSLGGTAVIRAAAQIPALRGVVTIGAPFDPWHASGLFAESHEEIEQKGEATVDIGGRPFRVRRQFLEDLGKGDLERDLRDLNRPLLIFHSAVDQVVGIENAAEIFHAARHPKSFISLDQANHLLTEERDARYVARALAGWASRYLPEPPAVSVEELKDAGIVTRTGEQGYRTEILAGGHALLADEPVRSGGTDTGPTPYDLIMAALGACTGITLRMYADRKGWPLEAVAVRMRHGRIYGEDRDECPDREVRVDRIERELELRGPLDEEQRARLTQIADRCPVHRTLSAGVKVETSVAPEEGSGAQLTTGTGDPDGSRA